MDGAEDLGVQAGDQPHRFERVEQALMVAEGVFAEGDWHPAEHHVGRQFGNPGGQGGLEVVAMAAAVPEEFDHLDLASRRGHRSGLRQAHVLFAFDRGALRQRQTWQTGTQTKGAQGGEGKLATIHLASFLSDPKAKAINGACAPVYFWMRTKADSTPAL